MSDYLGWGMIRVRVSREMIESAMKSGLDARCISGLPDDAHLTDVSLDGETLCLFFLSSTVERGDLVDILPVFESRVD